MVERGSDLDGSRGSRKGKEGKLKAKRAQGIENEQEQARKQEDNE